jgi:gas vesicle protein
MNLSDKSGSILTFGLGVGVGAVVALLMAPRRGEELRSDISEKAAAGVEGLKAVSKQVKRKTQNFVTHAKESIDEGVQAGEAALNSTNDESEHR